MHDLLDPKNDFVFKRIFGSEENKDILLAFLNRTFMEAGAVDGDRPVEPLYG